MHCRKGQPLQEGTKVYIPAIITNVSAGNEEQPWCNITIDTVHPMGEGTDQAYPTSLTLNARQVYRADSLDLPDVKPIGQESEVTA